MSGLKIRNALIFQEDGGFTAGELETRADLIVPVGSGTPDAEVIDAGGLYLIPGLIEIHCHGAMGRDFSDADAEGFATLARYHLSQGVTSFLGTSLTQPQAELETLFRAAARYMRHQADDAAMMRGIYMEGPYLSAEYAGAQNAAYLSAPDLAQFRALQACAEGQIRVLSLAPELPGGLEMIRALQEDVKIALGHSACSYEQASEAFEAGASLVTHLFNGMAAWQKRAPGLVGAASEYAQFAEIICDGQHLHPAVVRATFKLFGAERIVLISDSMRATGMPAGRYDLGGLSVQVKDGAAHLDDGRLAGSVSSLLACARQALSYGIPLDAVVRACTLNPARAAGLESEIGSLSPGKRADLLLIDAQFRVQVCILGGKVFQIQA